MNGPLSAKQLAIVLVIAGLIVASVLGMSRAARENHQAERHLQHVTNLLTP